MKTFELTATHTSRRIPTECLWLVSWERMYSCSVEPSRWMRGASVVRAYDRIAYRGFLPIGCYSLLQYLV